jgi:hypothetical protein
MWGSEPLNKTLKLTAHNVRNMPDDDKYMVISPIIIIFMYSSLIQYTEAEIYFLFWLHQQETNQRFLWGGKIALTHFLMAGKV